MLVKGWEVEVGEEPPAEGSKRWLSKHLLGERVVTERTGKLIKTVLEH